MRHTLLPLQERIMLRREYHRRVTIVFCFILSLAIMIGISTLFPTFIKALSVRAEADKEASKIENGNEDPSIKEIQKKVARSLTLLDSLKKEKAGQKISELINSVIYTRGKVRFTGFSATMSTTTFSMNIQGISPTRNDLLAFKSTLENMVPGNKVELPVSELAKSSNIPFSLQLKEKLP